MAENSQKHTIQIGVSPKSESAALHSYDNTECTVTLGLSNEMLVNSYFYKYTYIFFSIPLCPKSWPTSFLCEREDIM